MEMEMEDGGWVCGWGDGPRVSFQAYEVTKYDY